MATKLTINEELKTLYSEAATLKLILQKASGKNLYALENKEERERIAKYQKLFIKHLREFASEYKVSNDDIAKMLSTQVGGDWQIKCDYEYGKNVRLFASFSNLGVAARY